MFKVWRSVTLERALHLASVDLTHANSSDELVRVMAALEQLRMEGLTPPDGQR
jgi:hypothetical protein